MLTKKRLTANAVFHSGTLHLSQLRTLVIPSISQWFQRFQDRLLILENRALLLYPAVQTSRTFALKNWRIEEGCQSLIHFALWFHISFSHCKSFWMGGCGRGIDFHLLLLRVGLFYLRLFAFLFLGKKKPKTFPHLGIIFRYWGSRWSSMPKHLTITA